MTVALDDLTFRVTDIPDNRTRKLTALVGFVTAAMAISSFETISLRAIPAGSDSIRTAEHHIGSEQGGALYSARGNGSDAWVALRPETRIKTANNRFFELAEPCPIGEQCGAEGFGLLDTSAAFGGTINDSAATATRNSTAALKALVDHGLEHGVPVQILGKTYKVTPGIMAWDNGHRRTLAPTIYTCEGKTAFYVDHDTDPANALPIMKFSNGTYGSRVGEGVDECWEDGYIGGIRFVDTTGDAVTTRDGIQAYGWWRPIWGFMYGIQLRGSTVNFINKTVAGNPDYYHIGSGTFFGFGGKDVAGYVWRNDNGQGVNGCTVFQVQSQGHGLGGLRGTGAGNSFNKLSISYGSGWAVDSYNDAWGSLRDTYLGPNEIDANENGIRIDRGYNFRIVGHRVIPRFNSHASYPTSYVSRTFLNLVGNGATTGYFEINIRTEAGGALTDIGEIVDMNSVTFGYDVEVNVSEVLDNAALGIDVNTIQGLFSNVASGNAATLRQGENYLQDRRPQHRIKARSSGTVNLSNTGWGTAAANIILPTEVYDECSEYDTTTGYYTCGSTTKYEVSGQYLIEPGAGFRARVGVLRDRGGSIGLVVETHYPLTTADMESRVIPLTSIDCLKGDKLAFHGDCNTGAATPLTVAASQESSNFFQVRRA